MTRVAFLGPAGTFTEDALEESLLDREIEPLRTAIFRHRFGAGARR